RRRLLGPLVGSGQPSRPGATGRLEGTLPRAGPCSSGSRRAASGAPSSPPRARAPWFHWGRGRPRRGPVAAYLVWSLSFLQIVDLLECRGPSALPLDGGF